jgi:hypothetical protein
VRMLYSYSYRSHRDVWMTYGISLEQNRSNKVGGVPIKLVVIGSGRSTLVYRVTFELTG